MAKKAIKKNIFVGREEEIETIKSINKDERNSGVFAFRRTIGQAKGFRTATRAVPTPEQT